MRKNRLQSSVIAFILLVSPCLANALTAKEKPLFELTAFSSNAAVNSPDQIWDFSSLYLYRKNEYGAFGGVLNYTNRLNKNATQLYLNMQPKVNETMWFDLGYGYSNTPELFPNNMYFLEAYKKLGKTWVVSVGDTYKLIDRTYFNTLTASIGKYVGNYYLGFRPYHFVPKAGPSSTLLRFEAKKFGDNPDQYIGVSFATGTSPDLFDLLTVTFFKVKENIFFIQGQQPVNDAWTFLYGAGYQTQEFPSQFIRRLAYLNIGLKVKVT